MDRYTGRGPCCGLAGHHYWPLPSIYSDPRSFARRDGALPLIHIYMVHTYIKIQLKIIKLAIKKSVMCYRNYIVNYIQISFLLVYRM
jgi:hypothetical protein